MKSKTNDYLKYFKVTKAYYRLQHGLSSADFDMIFYLYSEDYFTKKDFTVFNKALPFDNNRFTRLVKDGWIINFRKHGGNRAGLYKVTPKTNRFCAAVYAVLNGEMPISESPTNNPMFRPKQPYKYRRYQEMILKMNKATRQRQHPKDEL